MDGFINFRARLSSYLSNSIGEDKEQREICRKMHVLNGVANFMYLKGKVLLIQFIITNNKVPPFLSLTNSGVAFVPKIRNNTRHD